MPRTRIIAHMSTRAFSNRPKHPNHTEQSSMNAIASIPSLSTSSAPDQVTRRNAVLTLVASAALLHPGTAAARATSSDLDDEKSSLVNVALGEGRWIPKKQQATPLLLDPLIENSLSNSFCTYATRFLIQYDAAIASWWSNEVLDSSLLLTDAEQTIYRARAFGSMAKSIQLGIFQQLQQQLQHEDSVRELPILMGKLYDVFWQKYGQEQDAIRQIAILFTLLPERSQPLDRLKEVAALVPTSAPASSSLSMKQLFESDYSALLPMQYRCIKIDPEEDRTTSASSSSFYQIDPPLQLFEVELVKELGRTPATATLFGPICMYPLTREMPRFNPTIYGLFGIAGATGCALTHTLVIPLDVVKTRAQTSPVETDENHASSISLLDSAKDIVQRDGFQGLLLGAQATIAGYFWYGLSVYPSYTFFKRFLYKSVDAATAMVHSNDISLMAGALAAVIASLGLTPLEAARIRAVADPATYQPLGVVGTLRVIASEGVTMTTSQNGWKALYAGFPSLVTRQVVFGSVKFLAFEQACAWIYSLWPFLQETVTSSLAVSLVAGGISGTLSSIISHPADALLTYVSKTTKSASPSDGFLSGLQVMIQEEGIGSLFRGLGSRCVWAGSIIAGQFLLYDLFRSYFQVTTEDLSQIFHITIPFV